MGEIEMRWENVYFLSWPFSPVEVAQELPERLSIDRFDKRAYVSVVGFNMESMRPSGFPNWMSVSFTEINLRTYVVGPHGRPGIYFFTLDADDRLSSALGRWMTGLKYRRTIAEVQYQDGKIHTEDVDNGEELLRAEIDYGKPLLDNDELAAFLCERYRFFSDAGELYTGIVEHDSWVLRHASTRIDNLGLFRDCGLPRPDIEPHALFSEGVKVRANILQRA